MKAYRPVCDCALDVYLADETTAQAVLEQHVCQPARPAPEVTTTQPCSLCADYHDAGHTHLRPVPTQYHSTTNEQKKEREQCLNRLMAGENPDDVATSMGKTRSWVDAVWAVAHRQGLA